MEQQLTALTEESKKLICDSLSKIAEIVSKAEDVDSRVNPPREVPLFFPHGIGSITLKVNVTGVAELSFSITGENAPKPTGAETSTSDGNFEEPK